MVEIEVSPWGCLRHCVFTVGWTHPGWDPGFRQMERASGKHALAGMLLSLRSG